nr:DUF305 domain-containing protein [Agrococcus sediminis]
MVRDDPSGCGQRPRLPSHRNAAARVDKRKEDGMADAMDDMMKHMDEMADSTLDELSSASGDEFDRKFLEMMIKHHAQAIATSELASSKAVHAELRELAAKMHSDQIEESEQLRSWHQQWGHAQD